MQSSLPSQSPSNGPQGWEVEQHVHVSLVQSQPEKVSKDTKEIIYYLENKVGVADFANSQCFCKIYYVLPLYF